MPKTKLFVVFKVKLPAEGFLAFSPCSNRTCSIIGLSSIRRIKLTSFAYSEGHSWLIVRKIMNLWEPSVENIDSVSYFRNCNSGSKKKRRSVLERETSHDYGLYLTNGNTGSKDNGKLSII